MARNDGIHRAVYETRKYLMDLLEKFRIIMNEKKVHIPIRILFQSVLC